MGKLNDIVPPYDLCLQIPQGEFDDSALSYFGSLYTENMIVAPTDIPCSSDTVYRICPAPTLDEIMRHLLGSPIEFRGDKAWEIWTEEGLYAAAPDPTVIAMQIWLKRNKKERDGKERRQE